VSAVRDPVSALGDPVSAAGDPSAPPERRGRGPGARIALRIAGFAAGIACAVVAFLRVDVAGMGRTLSGADPVFLALAMMANLGSLAAHAGRWRAVLHGPHAHVRWRDAVAALVAGFAAGIVLPARGGDVLRAHLLARRAGLHTSSVLVASGLDYVVGSVAFVALLGALVASAPLPAWVARTLWITAAAAAFLAAMAWILSPRSRAKAIPGHGVAGLVTRLRAGLAAARAPRALLEAGAWAVLGWTAEVGIALATLAALGLPATFTAAALAVVAATAAAAAGLGPGNAGSFELATSVALGEVGITPESALAFAVAFHLVHLVPVAVLGGAVLLRQAAGREPGVRGAAAPEPRRP
jgi:glycosyltransferase AglD